MPTLKFECGRDTCFVKKGKPCRFLMTEFFGQKFVCSLFNNQELTDLSASGWLQRLPECKKLDEK